MGLLASLSMNGIVRTYFRAPNYKVAHRDFVVEIGDAT